MDLSSTHCLSTLYIMRMPEIGVYTKQEYIFQVSIQILTVLCASGTAIDISWIISSFHTTVPDNHRQCFCRICSMFPILLMWGCSAVGDAQHPVSLSIFCCVCFEILTKGSFGTVCTVRSEDFVVCDAIKNVLLTSRLAPLLQLALITPHWGHTLPNCRQFYILAGRCGQDTLIAIDGEGSSNVRLAIYHVRREDESNQHIVGWMGSRYSVVMTRQQGEGTALQLGCA